MLTLPNDYVCDPQRHANHVLALEKRHYYGDAQYSVHSVLSDTPNLFLRQGLIGLIVFDHDDNDTVFDDKRDTVYVVIIIDRDYDLKVTSLYAYVRNWLKTGRARFVATRSGFLQKLRGCIFSWCPRNIKVNDVYYRMVGDQGKNFSLLYLRCDGKRKTCTRVRCRVTERVRVVKNNSYRFYTNVVTRHATVVRHRDAKLTLAGYDRSIFLVCGGCHELSWNDVGKVSFRLMCIKTTTIENGDTLVTFELHLPNTSTCLNIDLKLVKIKRTRQATVVSHE